MGKNEDLINTLARASGYCCGYAMLRANRKVRTGLLAKALGIEPRTLRYWRADLRAMQRGPCARCRRGDLDRPLPAFDRDADTSGRPTGPSRP